MKSHTAVNVKVLSFNTTDTTLNVANMTKNLKKVKSDGMKKKSNVIAGKFLNKLHKVLA